VDNAIKYTPQGGQVTVGWNYGTVSGDRSQVSESETDTRPLTSDTSASAVRIVVRDSGIGIKAKDQLRVFERFYRVDKARSRELGGTGLGLAIVKHLAQSFGGSVSVASEPGQGSTFTVELPAASTSP
jgi:two-component system phosphate regulon sensor histidine kinase PhoR